jgi:hypothetical protein
MDKDYSWILEERVTGKVYEESGNIQVWNKDGRTAILSYDSYGRLHFDGQFIDVGDDYMMYVSTTDEIAERGWSEPYNDKDPDS